MTDEPAALLRRRLLMRTPTGQIHLLLGLVRSAFDTTTENANGVVFAAELPWRELGIYGKRAAKLRSVLGDALGVPVPATTLFDHPTPLALAEHARARIIDGQRENTTPRPAQAPAGEPIAILGMACRYPGGVSSPEKLWDLVLAEQCGISDLPTDRGWDLGRLAHPDPEAVGTTTTRRGGFVDNGADFDAAFFEISPREAAAIHPEQRLLLETAWEALERAGVVPKSLRGHQVGVFVGAMSPEYGPPMHAAPPEVKGNVLTGSTPSVISGRVSYTFGFEGPSLTVDTACSSSLVAIHLASQSLRGGECELALAGGVTFTSTPGMFTEFSKHNALAPDGLCKSFAAGADGTAWSEGAGMLVLARLSDAQRLGYPVLGVIRSSAINQDGASNGLTAPNGVSQQRLIRQALAAAGLGAADVDAVEAHGTGTRLGDPIEANAILATYGQDRPAGQPLWLGSLKSNLGHTQAAAGVGGVIKMVMAMRHRVLPKTLHVDQPSPHVDWSAGAVRLLTERTPWPETGRPRRAAVSSFGISGTNAHTIIEEAPGGAGEVSELLPYVVSATSEQALRAQAQRLSEHMADRPDLDCGAVAWSLATCRSQFVYRSVVLANNRNQFLHGLDAVAVGGAAENVVRGVARTGGRVVFVFPGQGSQWEGMARGLLAESPVFAKSMAECADALAPYCDWSLLDLLRGDADVALLDRVDVVQPALFAVLVSLAELWKAHGVRPDAVIGHSQGEIAAAYVAGMLSLTDAAKTIALRSQVLKKIAGEGGMAAVALSPAEAERGIERWRDQLSIAVVNSPTSVVIAGERGALDEAVDTFSAADVRVRRIPVDYASHTRQVEPVRAEILEKLAGIAPLADGVPFYSTVTGGQLQDGCLDADYWYRNLRAPVRFVDAVAALLDEGGPVSFIEVSPHPVLLAAVEEIVDEAGNREVAVLSSLQRDDGGKDRFTRALAEAHVQGVELDWDAVFSGLRPRRVDLPTYAFQRQRYWLDGDTATADAASAGLVATGHPLVPTAIDLPESAGLALTGQMSIATQPWLAAHAVAGTALVPGAVFVELAIEACVRAGCSEVAELSLEVPLVLPDDGAIRLNLTLGAPDSTGSRQFSIYSQPTAVEHASWTRHGGGMLAATKRQPTFDLAVWPPADAQELDVTDLYDQMLAAGVDYGPAFRAVLAAWRRGEEVFAELLLPPESRTTHGRFNIHPVLLDAALHVRGLAPLVAETDLLPFLWTGVSLHATAGRTARLRLAPDGTGGVRVEVAGETGQPVATAESLVFRPLSAELLNRARTQPQAMPSRPGRVLLSQPIENLAVSNAASRQSGSDRSTELTRQLDGLPEDARRAELVKLVRRHAALVLGYASEVPEDRPFKELGLQSSQAIELRNRLNLELGHRLAATVVFQHPTPIKLALHLDERFGQTTGTAPPLGKGSPAAIPASRSDAPTTEPDTTELDTLDADALVELALREN